MGGRGRRVPARFPTSKTLAPPRRRRDSEQQPPPQQQESAVTLSSTTKRTVLAIADFVVPSGDADAAALSRLLPDVLWADFDFEREYSLVPRSKTASFGAPATPDDVAERRIGDLRARAPTPSSSAP